MSRVDADIARELDAAKRYAEDDPQAALGKLRNVLERTVRLAFPRLTNCEPPPMAKLNDLLDDPRFVAVVPDNVLERMHDVRLRGNRAVHAEAVSLDDVRRAVHNIDAILEWAARSGLVQARSPAAPDIPSPRPVRTYEPPPAPQKKFSSREKALFVMGYLIFGLIPVAMLVSRISNFVMYAVWNVHLSCVDMMVGLVVAIVLPFFVWRRMND